MTTPAGELIIEAFAPAPDQRSVVVTDLPDSHDGEDETIVAKAWADEIGKRRAELRSGPVRAVLWSEARARLSALY